MNDLVTAMVSKTLEEIENYRAKAIFILADELAIPVREAEIMFCNAEKLRSQ